MAFGRARPDATLRTTSGSGLDHTVSERVVLIYRPVEEAAINIDRLVRILRDDLPSQYWVSHNQCSSVWVFWFIGARMISSRYSFSSRRKFAASRRSCSIKSITVGNCDMPISILAADEGFPPGDPSSLSPESLLTCSDSRRITCCANPSRLERSVSDRSIHLSVAAISRRPSLVRTLACYKRFNLFRP